MTYEGFPVSSPNFVELGGGLPHAVCRRELNAKLVQIAATDLGFDVVRRPVPDHAVSWNVALPDYYPQLIDVPRGNSSFRKEGDRPDPANPRKIAEFVSLETPVVLRDERGYPLNPMGRTGLRGRGMLDKWGATPAADPILTRHNPETGVLEVLLIQRGDTGEWALPGGKVDDGEEPWQAAGRELMEEAGVRGVRLDFSAARIVFAGYVDDSRNTDNAWMETTALHLHLDDHQAWTVRIEPGSDAIAAQWVAVTEKLYDSLFASHGQYLRPAVETL